MYMMRRDHPTTIAAVLTLALVVATARGQPPTPVTDNVPVDTRATTDLPGSAAWTSTGSPPSPSVNGSKAEGLKKVMWKRCMSKNYVTCVKLALVHFVDRLERANDSYSLAPGVTVSSDKKSVRELEMNDTGDNVGPTATLAGRDSSEVFDRFLVDKLGRYFSTLTLNVRLLDETTVQSVRKLGEAAVDASAQSGRGKKQKYAHSILLAGWVTGAMLLAFGLKAIAVLAGKALMTALMSLLLSALASFKQGGQSQPKSTTYEIVTKPVYSHSHSTADDTHAAGSQNNPTYRRSIGTGGIVNGVVSALQHVAPASSEEEEADHVVYRIHTSDKTPIYIPIERRRRRRR